MAKEVDILKIPGKKEKRQERENRTYPLLVYQKSFLWQGKKWGAKSETWVNGMDFVHMRDPGSIPDSVEVCAL